MNKHNRLRSLRSAALTLFVLFLCSCQPAQAQGIPGQPLLYIGHLNNDCAQDSVVGRQYAEGTWLPELIFWGRGAALAACDSSVRHPAGTPQPVATVVAYPQWEHLAGSVSFGRYNAEDSLPDMALYLWGISPLTGRDTARFVLVFGQVALDTLPLLHIGQMNTDFQSQPFFALDLNIREHFDDPRVRDLTGVVSYEFLPVYRKVVAHGGTHLAGPPADSPATTVHVYPNPTELGARLESGLLEAGEYMVTVLAVNGREYYRETVQVAVPQQLERELNFSGLPNGTYVVRLHRDGRVISTYPIIVLR